MRLLKSFVLLLLVAGLRLAFASPTGNWKCVATSSTGEKLPITIVVKDDGGKLSGDLIMESGDRLPLVEPKADGNDFRFKININDQAYQVELKIDGGKISGKYSGPEASGTIEGEKQAS
jgi:hypothetical protein